MTARKQNTESGLIIKEPYKTEHRTIKLGI